MPFLPPAATYGLTLVSYRAARMAGDSGGPAVAAFGQMDGLRATAGGGGCGRSPDAWRGDILAGTVLRRTAWPAQLRAADGRCL
jgi:hypothetical protein